MLVYLCVLAVVAAAGSLYFIVARKMNLWLWPYLVQAVGRQRKDAAGERHIILAICDHFDFGSAGKYRLGEEAVLDTWEARFPPLSQRHRDSDGVRLKHTWFFPPHYHRADYLERLVGLCATGCGEIELHLHHDHMSPYPDTSKTLREKLRSTILEYSKFGVFCLPDARKTFGFIHGDWALDNSRGGRHCGVNDEIRILAEEGCYADFTFPSLQDSQPRTINSIYYVADDPDKPKSYDRGIPVTVGGTESGDLMLVQGPLGLRLKTRYGFPFFPAIDYGELEVAPLTMDRMKSWIRANVHVVGRPDWVFVKLHTHGAMRQNEAHNLGKMAEQFFSELEKTFRNPGSGSLHYVTAREMFNIIKAAEAGMTGNPGDFRDYKIPRYVYLR